MVDFTNITFDTNWIYADAYDHDFKVSGRIKVHRTQELFETNCTVTNQFQKAAWVMRRDVNKGKLKQNSKRTVAWG